MGNRATIAIEGNDNISLYLHWQGGKGSVQAFVSEALKRNCVEERDLPEDFIFHLHSAIKDFFNFAGEKQYRKRDNLNLYIQFGTGKNNGDNGHYLIKKDGSIDFSEANYIESKEYTKESGEQITEFFKQLDKLLLEADSLE